MAPDRRSELARIGLRAMFGGALACWMTGAIAGFSFDLEGACPMHGWRCSAMRRLVAAAAVLAAASTVFGQSAADGGAKWFRGNLHTHTWWSDGDSPRRRR